MSLNAYVEPDHPGARYSSVSLARSDVLAGSRAERANAERLQSAPRPADLLGMVGLILRNNGSRDKSAPAPLRNAASNLLAVAAAHELLYRRSANGDVRLDTYLIQLCAALEDLCSGQGVKIQPLAEPLALPGRLAAPLGLFASEAIMSRLAYGCAGDRIIVRLYRSERRCTFSVDVTGARLGAPMTKMMSSHARRLDGASLATTPLGRGERIQLTFLAS